MSLNSSVSRIPRQLQSPVPSSIPRFQRPTQISLLNSPIAPISLAASTSRANPSLDVSQHLTNQVRELQEQNKALGTSIRKRRLSVRDSNLQSPLQSTAAPMQLSTIADEQYSHIQQLEQQMSELQAKNEALQVQLQFKLQEAEDSKKGFKNQNKRLRIELVSRQHKQRWDYAVMDQEERAMEIELLHAQHDLTNERLSKQLLELDMKELQETLHQKELKITQLFNSRRVLLDSTEVNDVKETLEKSLKTVESKFANEEKAHKATLSELRRAQTQLNKQEKAMEETKRLIEIEREKTKELEKQVAEWDDEEIQEQLEREIKARKRAEEELAELKGSTKTSTTQKKTEKKTKETKAKKPVVEESESEESEQDVEGAEGSEPQSSPPAPPAPKPTRKRKVETADESTETSSKRAKKSKETTSNPKKPKSKKTEDESVAELARTTTATSSTNKNQEEEGTKKKKKIKLFASTKTGFEMPAIDSANNKFGLPVDLSPTKTGSRFGGSMFGLKKPNIFSK